MGQHEEGGLRNIYSAGVWAAHCGIHCGVASTAYVYDVCAAHPPAVFSAGRECGQRTVEYTVRWQARPTFTTVVPTGSPGKVPRTNGTPGTPGGVQDRAVHHSIPLVNSCERNEHAREVDGRADVVGLLAFLHLSHEDLLLDAAHKEQFHLRRPACIPTKPKEITDSSVFKGTPRGGVQSGGGYHWLHPHSGSP